MKKKEFVTFLVIIGATTAMAPVLAQTAPAKAAPSPTHNAATKAASSPAQIAAEKARFQRSQAAALKAGLTPAQAAVAAKTGLTQAQAAAAVKAGYTPAQIAAATAWMARIQAEAAKQGIPKRNYTPRERYALWRQHANIWRNYLTAGEQFDEKGDKARAKQYYMYSLNLFERTKPRNNHLSGSFGRLEDRILSLYPRFPEQAPEGEPAAQIKMGEEEVAVLARLQRVNQNYKKRNRNDLMANLVDSQTRYASEFLKKTKAEHPDAVKPQ